MLERILFAKQKFSENSYQKKSSSLALPSRFPSVGVPRCARHGRRSATSGLCFHGTPPERCCRFEGVGHGVCTNFTLCNHISRCFGTGRAIILSIFVGGHPAGIVKNAIWIMLYMIYRISIIYWIWLWCMNIQESDYYYYYYYYYYYSNYFESVVVQHFIAFWFEDSSLNLQQAVGVLAQESTLWVACRILKSHRSRLKKRRVYCEFVNQSTFSKNTEYEKVKDQTDLLEPSWDILSSDSETRLL